MRKLSDKMGNDGKKKKSIKENVNPRPPALNAAVYYACDQFLNRGNTLDDLKLLISYELDDYSYTTDKFIEHNEKVTRADVFKSNTGGWSQEAAVGITNPRAKEVHVFYHEVDSVDLPDELAKYIEDYTMYIVII